MVHSQRVLGSFAVACLLLAACGDDSGDPEAGATSTTAGGSSMNAGAEPASGEPIVLGLINTEGNPQLDFTEYRLAAEAAVEYVNAELGGVDGRPLVLETCATVGSPEASTGCVNQILEANPVAVVAGVDIATSATMAIWEQAGIAYLGTPAFQQPEQQSPVAFSFASWSPGSFGSLAYFAVTELDADVVRVLAIDNPGNTFQFENHIENVLEHEGVTDVELLTQPVSATDWTATWSTAMSAEPDAVIAIAGAGLCAPIFQGRQSLGVEVPLLMPGACADPEVLASVGAAADGTYFSVNYQPLSSEDPEVALFREKLEQYGGGDVGLSTFAQAGFGAVMNIQEVFSEIGAESLTREAVLEAFRGLVDHHNFMGQEMTCDGEQVPDSPALCTSGSRVVQFSGGEFTELTEDWIDIAAVLAE